MQTSDSTSEGPCALDPKKLLGKLLGKLPEKNAHHRFPIPSAMPSFVEAQHRPPEETDTCRSFLLADHTDSP